MPISACIYTCIGQICFIMNHKTHEIELLETAADEERATNEYERVTNAEVGCCEETSSTARKTDQTSGRVCK